MLNFRTISIAQSKTNKQRQINHERKYSFGTHDVAWTATRCSNMKQQVQLRSLNDNALRRLNLWIHKRTLMSLFPDQPVVVNISIYITNMVDLKEADMVSVEGQN